MPLSFVSLTLFINNRYIIKSHIGYLLKAGDVVVGYQVNEATLVDDEAEELRGGGKMTDIVIVRKLYGGVAQGLHEADAAKNRSWRLQKLDAESKEDEEKSSRNAKKIKALNEMDEEDFLREVEADKELRANVNLYVCQASERSELFEHPQGQPHTVWPSD